MNDFTYILQITNICFCLVGISLWVYWGMLAKTMWLYAVAPITLLLHVIVYYTVLLVSHTTPAYHNEWSAVIRMQSTLTFVLAGLVMVLEIRMRRIEKKRAVHNARLD